VQQKLKQLKSNITGLRVIFEKQITVRNIAEKLEACRVGNAAVQVRETMIGNDYDVLGVRDGDTIVGYVELSDVEGVEVITSWTSFQPPSLITDSTPIIDLLSIMRDRARVFVLERDCATGIVTRGDLQKAPVRMLLFGIVTLLEMNFLRIIRSHFPDDSWRHHLPLRRLEKAEKLFKSLRKSKEEIDATDCLELCDKSALLIQDDEIRRKLGFSSKAQGRRVLSSIERFRNDLAHGQDLGQRPNRWLGVIQIASTIEKLLTIVEKI
jgi:hypothetical protein